jgi:hypothetical protein
LLLLSAAQAKAEDFYWTGFYAGVIGGGGPGPSTFFTPSSGSTASFDVSGGLIGVEIGAAALDEPPPKLAVRSAGLPDLALRCRSLPT